MNDSDRQLLLAVSGLLHYPDDDFFVQARSFEELCDLLSVVRACPLREFIRSARSKGLSRLRELYRDAGFEPVQGLLPDYLPLVLEFFAAAPDWARVVLLDGFGKELIGIYAVLEARHPDSSYVSLFRPIVAVLGLVPDQRLPAKRLEQV